MLQGFQAHALKPSICKECGHSSIYHTIIQSNEVDKEAKVGDDVLAKRIWSEPEI